MHFFLTFYVYIFAVLAKILQRRWQEATCEFLQGNFAAYKNFGRLLRNFVKAVRKAPPHKTKVHSKFR